MILDTISISPCRLLFVVQTDHPTILKYDILKILSMTYASSCDQAQKSGLGLNEKIVVFYENVIVIQFNVLPLVITLLADPSANVGLLIQLEHDLASSVEPLRQQIQIIDRDNHIH